MLIVPPLGTAVKAMRPALGQKCATPCMPVDGPCTRGWPLYPEKCPAVRWDKPAYGRG